MIIVISMIIIFEQEVLSAQDYAISACGSRICSRDLRKLLIPKNKPRGRGYGELPLSDPAAAKYLWLKIMR